MSKKEKEKRFITLLKEGSTFSYKKILFADKETGVTYLLIKDGYGCAVTPLLEANGKPVITKTDNRINQ